MNSRYLLLIATIGIAAILSSCATHSTPRTTPSSSTAPSKSASTPRPQPATVPIFVAGIVADNNQDLSSYSPRTGAYFGKSSQFLPGGGTLTNMFLGRNKYLLQVEPTSRKPVWIKLEHVPNGVTWELSQGNIATLTRNSGMNNILQFQSDGRIELHIKDSDKTVLIIEVSAQSFKDGWQVVLGEKG